jgi:choline monooxygenase
MQVSGVDEHHRCQGTGAYVGLCTDPLTAGNTPLDPFVIPHFPSLTENGGRHKRAIFHAIFPNVFYFMLPHSMFTVISFPDPDRPNRTMEFADLTVHKSVLELPDAQEKIEAMWQFYDLTNKEDVEVCENVQKGARVYEYKGGRLSFRFEETIHR